MLQADLETLLKKQLAIDKHIWGEACAIDKEVKIKDLTDPVLLEENWDEVKDKVKDIEEKDRPERVFTM
jgi:hypothetical protein